MKNLSAIIFLWLVAVTAVAQLKGKVVKITDGDTFTLLTADNESIRIRLHGIDCPEKGQAYGQVAKKFLSDLIFNKQVTVKKTDVDRYQRTIGIVFIDDINVNEKLLEVGLAWHYTKYDQNNDWAKLEQAARKGKKGLWQRNDAIAPWEFRRKLHNS